LTQRKNALDPGKLAWLNKHHLMEKVQSSDQLPKLASRLEEILQNAPFAGFDQRFTGHFYLEKVLQLLAVCSQILLLMAMY
jgi:hypothetical protein